jgi:hypothetical protein
MKLRLQFGRWLLALASIVGMALPCAAQKRDNNKPPQQRQQQRQAPRQERRQPQQESRRAQNGRPGNDRAHNNVAPNRQSNSMGMIGGNRPPNARESGQRPDFNPNRPPSASNSQANGRRFQDLSPAEKQRVLQNREKFNRLPPQRQQEIREAAQNWKRLTPEQQTHIKNDVLPRWQQMPADRQRAIRQRLGVLQNMPESARNQHLNDPNFTRGMSEEDKAMLRDLSHMHVGAPDPPNE